MVEEKLVFRIPISKVQTPQVPPEEIIQPVAIQTALMYKTLQEIKKATAELTELVEKTSELVDKMSELVEQIKSSGEVLQFDKLVDNIWTKIEPGRGSWRGLNIYNAGDGTCEIKLNRLDSPSIYLGSGESKSYMFLTPCITAVYVKCDPPSKIELEFLR
jgi:hypothetical protein